MKFSPGCSSLYYTLAFLGRPTGSSKLDIHSFPFLKKWQGCHVSRQGALCDSGWVKPSAKPWACSSIGLQLHMGHSLLRCCDDLIHTMRFQR